LAEKEERENLENKLLSIHIKIDSNGDTTNHNIQKIKESLANGSKKNTIYTVTKFYEFT